MNRTGTRKEPLAEAPGARPGPAPGAGRLRPRRRSLAPLPEPGGGALEMPGERVLLLRVALPLASHRQRQAAAAFAVEDLVAEPIEALHVALGPALADGEYLVAVVRHADMAEWAPRAAASGRRLVPDSLAMPVPAEGSWSVREAGGRVLARLPDGTGFATDVDAFETFWRAGSRPQIVLFGGCLPPAIPVGATALPPAGADDAAGLDLMQGLYAPTVGEWRRHMPRFAVLAAVTLAAHLAVFAADALSLQALASAREAELRAALAERLGGPLPETLPLAAALDRALPAPEAEAPRFLPLLARIASALAPLAGEIGFRALAYGSDGEVAVTIEAAGLATIQRVERDLSASGLAVRAGAVTTGNGAAEARFVVGDAS